MLSLHSHRWLNQRVAYIVAPLFIARTIQAVCIPFRSASALLLARKSTFLCSAKEACNKLQRRISFVRVPESDQLTRRCLFSAQSHVMSTADDAVLSDYTDCPKTVASHQDIDQPKPPYTYSYVEPLTRTAIRRMRVGELREELARRGLVGLQIDSMKKPQLVEQLIDALTSKLSTFTAPPSIANRASENSTILTADDPIPTMNCTNTGNQAHINDIHPDSNRRYLIRIKGLSDSKSNGTGVGIVLRDEVNNTVIWQASKYYATSRSLYEAEYSGLVLAIRFALVRFELKFLRVQIDQALVVNQLNGQYKVEKDSLMFLYSEVMNLVGGGVARGGVILFEKINREANAECEQLATTAVALGISSNMGDEADDDGSIELARLASDPLGDFVAPLQLKPAVEKVRAPATSWITSFNSADSPVVVIDPSATYTLRIDGGARGNPNGVAGAGAAIFNEHGEEVWFGWKFLSTSMSNNQAEYHAVQMGLKCARSLGIQSIQVEGDSELVIKQLTGVYQVKNEALRKIWRTTKDEIRHFKWCGFKHIYREENKRADWLANTAMDLRSSYGFVEELA